MAKTKNSEKASNFRTTYGDGYGKVHIIHDMPIVKGSIPTTNKTPPPPKSKTEKK